MDQWLRDIALEQYAPVFARHHLDVSILPELTANDLDRMGITSVGHQKRILKHAGGILEDHHSALHSIIATCQRLLSSIERERCPPSPIPLHSDSSVPAESPKSHGRTRPPASPAAAQMFKPCAACTFHNTLEARKCSVCQSDLSGVKPIVVQEGSGSSDAAFAPSIGFSATAPPSDTPVDEDSCFASAIPLVDTPEMERSAFEPVGATAPEKSRVLEVSVIGSLEKMTMSHMFRSDQLRALIEEERRNQAESERIQRLKSEAVIEALLREERRLAAEEKERLEKDGELAAALLQEEREEEERRAMLASSDRRLAQDTQLQFGLNVQGGECEVCEEPLMPGEGASLRCGHLLCVDCVAFYIKDAIQQRKTLPCPGGGCSGHISARDVRAILGEEDADEYASIEQRVLCSEMKGMWHCKTPDCPNGVLVEGERNRKWHCSACEKDWCVVCDSEWHDGSTCEQYQEWRAENGIVDQAFDELVEQGVIRVCVCGRPIIKNGGCAQVTCKCGVKFCWVCNEVLKKGGRCAHVKYH